MNALESAQKLENGLNDAKHNTSISLITLITQSRKLNKNKLQAAFRQLDRYRCYEKVKDLEHLGHVERTNSSRYLENNVFTTPMSSGHASRASQEGMEESVVAIVCQDCDRRKDQLRELMLNLNDTAFDLEHRLRSLKSSAVKSLIDKIGDGSNR